MCDSSRVCLLVQCFPHSSRHTHTRIKWTTTNILREVISPSKRASLKYPKRSPGMLSSCRSCIFEHCAKTVVEILGIIFPIRSRSIDRVLQVPSPDCPNCWHKCLVDLKASANDCRACKGARPEGTCQKMPMSTVHLHVTPPCRQTVRRCLCEQVSLAAQ
jgi:hypothetical protein